MSNPAFTVFVLSEDGSEHAPEVIKRLLKSMFRFIDERCQTHRIGFQPPDDPDVRRVVIANQFLNRTRRERVSLYKYLAERLRSDDAFIVHHIDADVPWGRREQTPPEKVDRIPREILAHVRTFLSKFYSDSEIEERLRRYLVLVPYHELEAWLYQHTDVALRLCREHPACRGRHAALLADWKANRGLLDERDDLEGCLQPCVGKHHNEDLAGPAYPIKDVVDAEKSLAAAVQNFFECTPLLDALGRTYLSPSS